jgi:hypothetical protein
MSIVTEQTDLCKLEMFKNLFLTRFVFLNKEIMFPGHTLFLRQKYPFSAPVDGYFGRSSNVTVLTNSGIDSGILCIQDDVSAMSRSTDYSGF